MSPLAWRARSAANVCLRKAAHTCSLGMDDTKTDGLNSTSSLIFPSGKSGRVNTTISSGVQGATCLSSSEMLQMSCSKRTSRSFLSAIKYVASRRADTGTVDRLAERETAQGMASGIVTQ